MWVLGNADAHVRYRQWDLSLESVKGAPVSGWEPCWGSSPLQTFGWVALGREAEEVLSGALKITQHGMIKRRRSYGSMWQSPFISLSLSLSSFKEQKQKRPRIISGIVIWHSMRYPTDTPTLQGRQLLMVSFHYKYLYFWVIMAWIHVNFLNINFKWKN